MSRIAVVTTTVGDEGAARTLAERVIDERLAACVQTEGPINSRYRWRGEIENAQEWRVVAKTTDWGATRLAEFLASVHPYELPEILLHEVTAFRQEYAAWVADQLACPE